MAAVEEEGGGGPTRPRRSGRGAAGAEGPVLLSHRRSASHLVEPLGPALGRGPGAGSSKVRRAGYFPGRSSGRYPRRATPKTQEGVLRVGEIWVCECQNRKRFLRS